MRWRDLLMTLDCCQHTRASALTPVCASDHRFAADARAEADLGNPLKDAQLGVKVKNAEKAWETARTHWINAKKRAKAMKRALVCAHRKHAQLLCMVHHGRSKWSLLCSVCLFGIAVEPWQCRDHAGKVCMLSSYHAMSH